LFLPTTPATGVVRDKLAQLHRILRPWRDATPANLLPAFYDLGINPVTFDFAWFIVGAEMAARSAGKAGFLLVLVPGTVDGLREEANDYEQVVDVESRKWRLRNILLPVASLSPACRSIVLCTTRDQAAKYVSHIGDENYPPHYQPRFPRGFDYVDFFSKADRPGSFEGLRASEQGRRYVANWANGHAKGRKLITVTLRNQLYQQSRNSNFDSWLQFLNGLDRQIYAPVIVPDTDAALDLLLAPSDLIIFREAAWNIGLRMSLYEFAYANLFVNNGPAALAHLNPLCHYLFTNIVVPDYPQSTEGFLIQRGIQPNQSPRFATRGQIWWWKQDSMQNLRDGFQTLIETIEENGG